MKIRITFKITLTVIVTVLSFKAYTQNFVSGEIIVKIDQEITGLQFASQVKTVSLIPVKQLSSRMNIWLFNYPTQIPIENVINNVKLNHNAIYVQPNRYVQQRNTFPNDPQFINQWALQKIKAPQAWNITSGGTTVNNEQIVIAVIDGGFDLNHQDIIGKG